MAANHIEQTKQSEATSDFFMQRLQISRFIAFLFVLASHVLLSDKPPSHLSR
jgi:hypothetical protein